WMLARNKFVGDDAPRVDVRSLVGSRITGRLLRRHVHRRADVVARLGYLRRALPGEWKRFLPRRRDGLGNPEIGYDRGAFAEQNVLGLDVAVDDSLLVRVG